MKFMSLLASGNHVPVEPTEDPKYAQYRFAIDLFNGVEVPTALRDLSVVLVRDDGVRFRSQPYDLATVGRDPSFDNQMLKQDVYVINIPPRQLARVEFAGSFEGDGMIALATGTWKRVESSWRSGRSARSCGARPSARPSLSAQILPARRTASLHSSLFTAVPGREILRTSHVRNSRKFGCRLLTLPYGGGFTLASMFEHSRTQAFKIGEIARLSGLSVKTVRYYERRGLLEQPSRTEGGYRLYGQEEVARIRFIQRAKLLGLTLEEIRELVELAARCNEGEIVPRLEEVLEAKLEETERKMAELAALRQNLLYYRERAEALKDCVPTNRYCEDVSFCGCLEAVTEGGEKL